MRFPVGRVVLIVAALATAPVTLSCDQIEKQLSATDFAVAVLLSTPPIPNPHSPNDMLPGISTLSVLVGSADPTAIATGSVGAGAVTPEDDATVSVGFTRSGTPVSVSVPSKGKGLYSATSKDSMIELDAGTEYTVTIARAGKTYKLKGTAPATPVVIKEFASPNPRLIMNYDYMTNNGFTVTRDGNPMTNKVAFVAMEKVDGSTMASATPMSGGLTYTNAPSTPLDFLKLLIDPSDWQANTFQIPADKFVAMTPFLVTLTEVTQGTQVNDSSTSALQPQSTFLIGTADGGGVITK